MRLISITDIHSLPYHNYNYNYNKNHNTASVFVVAQGKVVIMEH